MSSALMARYWRDLALSILAELRHSNGSIPDRKPTPAGQLISLTLAFSQLQVCTDDRLADLRQPTRPRR